MMYVNGLVAKRWPEWFPSDPSVQKVRPIVVRSTSFSRKKAVVFLIREGDSVPRAVLKIAFDQREEQVLAREYEALSRVRSEVPPPIAERIPRPLALLRDTPMSALVLVALRGRRLTVPSLASRGSPPAKLLMKRYLRESIHWTRELEAATRRPIQLDEEMLSEIPTSFIGEFSVDRPTADRARSLGKAVGRSRIRWSPAWQHGDLSVGNVLKSGKKLKFVDWEYAVDNAKPWFDVAYLPGSFSHLAWMQEGGRSLRSAALKTLRTSHWFGAGLRQRMQEVWDYPLPLQWAVTLNMMETALRQLRRGDRHHPVADLAIALLADSEFRREADWLAPDW